MRKVAVVTRTKDRAIMLRRAAESVKAQKFKDLEWIVVNDGGDPSEVDRCLAESDLGEIDYRVIHQENKGMEAASNVGIRSSACQYYVIHDDDDTWNPDFLAKTVAFLEEDTKGEFSGVITRSRKITEVVKDDRIIQKADRKWLPNAAPAPSGCIQIAEMAIENQFPPIAFLVRRSAYDRLGGYDERLPVLGDWDFNLRLLLDGEIACIDEALAHYHYRVGAGNALGNSVNAGMNKHVVYDAVIRNRAIRSMTGDTARVASLLAQGRISLVLLRRQFLLRALRRLKQIFA